MDIFRNFQFLYNVNGYHRSPHVLEDLTGQSPISMEQIPEFK